MTGPAVRLEGVVVSRGASDVLRGVSLEVPAGGAVGIAGSNGAGKTTLLDVISGVVRPDDGSVFIDGADRTSDTPRQRSRSGVARTFQESHLYPQLTVAEALRVASAGRSPAVSELAAIGLAGRGTSYVSELSTGQRRRLEFAAATARGATLLLLDEPTAGTAPQDRDALVGDISAWRERTGGTLIVVEHDRGALVRLVDSVTVLDAGLVDEELAARRYHEPAVRRFDLAPSVDRRSIAALIDTIPQRSARGPRTRGASTWSLARFGLREFAAGMLSVLTLGVLNRVMKVELGIPLALVASVLAAYNLAAPVALWAGALSDRRPIRGRHRTPYILGGAALMAVAAAVAPFVAWSLAPPTVIAVCVAVAVFAAMGAGMYGSGAVYFALLAEVVQVHRERAVAVVYSMLMAGILAGVALSTFVMPNYDERALLSLFGVVAVAIVACTWWAIRGAEAHGTGANLVPPLRLRGLLGKPGATRFFVFMIGITFFAFLQQALLEPFGGDVFGMSVARTTSFNAVQIVAVLVGMGIAARSIAPRIGKKHTTVVGTATAAAGTALLATSGIRTSEVLLYAGIAALGLGLGILNVGSLSLMLDMTVGTAAGLSMGLWTVAHALADGAATAGGGVLHAIAEALLGSTRDAYTAVFAIQAVGLIVVLRLLSAIDPEAFRGARPRTIQDAPTT